MHSNVIQIDHKYNKTDKCYSNGIYWKERRPQYKSDKISAAALFQKHNILLHLIEKNVTHTYIHTYTLLMLPKWAFQLNRIKKYKFI